MTLSAEETARKSADVMWKDDRATQDLGAVLEKIGPGSSELSMTVRESMVNGHGLCHGGYIFTLADSAFAFACNSHNLRAVAQHCSISFLAPAKLNQKLIASASEIHRAERSGVTDVTVRTADGTVIAEFRGTSRIIGGTLF
ncbi:hydroxyphenylacetyl-CoA thioesterase PaaI [Ferrovibrio sp.]|uniref:hydroxyphenylacetyl-CoA thioesterase PaaI n=1 Tax=Ferrovibrio sp. TaxID=1917215 RepID=UPI00311E7B32